MPFPRKIRNLQGFLSVVKSIRKCSLGRSASVSITNGKSSQPSSQSEFRGKVTNNREKSDRRPGAQPGHEWYGRKKHAVNGGSVFIPAPDQMQGIGRKYF